jgi:hypothetical protein
MFEANQPKSVAPARKQNFAQRRLHVNLPLTYEPADQHRSRARLPEGVQRLWGASDDVAVGVAEQSGQRADGKRAAR